MGGGYVESVREVAINRRQRKMEERNKVSFIICLKKEKDRPCGGSVGSVCLLVPSPYFADHNL